MKASRLIVVAAISAAFGMPALADSTAPQYTIVDIGKPTGNNVSHADGVSDSGDYVVGRGVVGSNSAYVWTQSGGMAVLPGYSTNNWAVSVNNLGLVVGMASTASGVSSDDTYYTTSPVPVMWQTGSSGAIATPLALPTGQVQGRVFDDNGLAVGSVGVAGTIGQRAVIYNTSGGTASYITGSTSDGETMVNATRINDAGLVIGTAADGTVLAYDSSSGTMTQVANLDGSGNVLSAMTGVFGVNGNGEVVGYTGTSTAPSAAEWSASGGLTMLPVPAGTISSMAIGITSQGWIVGTATEATGVDPFLIIDGQTYDLGSLTSGLSGWTFSSVSSTTITGIGDNGVITGYTGDLAEGGKSHAFALVPVPEPASAALMLGGLLAVGAITRRRSAARNR